MNEISGVYYLWAFFVLGFIIFVIAGICEILNKENDLLFGFGTFLMAISGLFLAITYLAKLFYWIAN